RGPQCDCARPRSDRRCWTSWLNLGERWSSRLVATAAESRLTTPPVTALTTAPNFGTANLSSNRSLGGTELGHLKHASTFTTNRRSFTAHGYVCSADRQCGLIPIALTGSSPERRIAEN